MTLVTRKGPHGQQEFANVVAVQSGGLLGHAAWQVGVPNACNTLSVEHIVFSVTSKPHSGDGQATA